ncbi:epoxide hydrolase family protein [Sphingopyxis sp. CCNWLW253]|uniref:epoxide hydrolase family protein n=1 Tax=unclassified Sphingopyxis TaxID=2614943 RepID=UPI00301316E5
MTVTPFHIAVPDQVLDRISRKLADARLGYAPEDADPWAHGMSADYLGDFVDYWRASYNWREQEEALNAWPQFKAEIDGIQIHFYHIRGRGDRPKPILLTHGWPGSVAEFQVVMPLLAGEGFSLVVPSLPGFGWSGRPAKPIGPVAVASLWRRLMTDVLGYEHFFAQGGDFGSAVTVQLALNHPDVVDAIHLNFFMPPQPGADADAALLEYWGKVRQTMEAESGYHHEQATKPQTIGLALHDNPVGWAAWVLEKFHGWGDTGGNIESRFSKDHLITNLMTYLVSDTIISSFWMYYASGREPRTTGPVTVPTALARFPAEFYPMPDRALAERQYAVAQWTEMKSGGHFAAMEEPEAFAEDVIAFFKSR